MPGAQEGRGKQNTIDQFILFGIPLSRTMAISILFCMLVKAVNTALASYQDLPCLFNTAFFTSYFGQLFDIEKMDKVSPELPDGIIVPESVVLLALRVCKGHVCAWWRAILLGSYAPDFEDRVQETEADGLRWDRDAVFHPVILGLAFTVSAHSFHTSLDPTFDKERKNKLTGSSVGSKILISLWCQSLECGRL
eukprot:1994984-Amphidinium_carterae.1